MITRERTHLQEILPLQGFSWLWLTRLILSMKFFTLSSGTARPIYRIRTKSKALEANGRAFKLANGMGMVDRGEEKQRAHTSSREPT